MKKIIATLMACIALTACSTDKVVPALPEHMFLGQIGCITLGAPLKGVAVSINGVTGMYLIKIACGDGTIRLEVDLPVNPPIVKELPALLKGTV